MDSVSKVPEAQNALISLLNEGDLLLSKQQPQNALNVLLQAHEAAMTLYSNQPAGQIPTLTLLGSAHLGCGDVKSAEKCLTQAHWALMKCERPSPSQRHLLHRQLGQLYYLKGMAPEALAHMAEDAFYASEADGTDSLQVGLAYFTMGNLFHTSEDDEKAKVYFHQAAELWYAHLQHVIADEDYSQLDQCTSTRGERMLHHLQTVLVEQAAAPFAVAAAKAVLAGAMLAWLRQEGDQAKAILSTAAEVVAQSEESPHLDDVKRYCKWLETDCFE